MIREWLGLVRSLAVYWRPGRQRALRELYEPFVSRGDLVFDVGAHVGDRVAAFSALGARVVALEPHPGIFPWLRRIVGRKEGVILRQEAVGGSPGTGVLAKSRATPTVSTLADGWRRKMPDSNPSFRGVRWEDPVEVPVTTLDRLIDTFGIPDFCKIDVEGYEAEVLSGLSRTVPALSVEFVAGGLEVARACLDRLEELGEYEFNAVSGEEREYRFDSWVDPAALRAWLDAGADGVSSGDLYARLRAPDPDREVPLPEDSRA
ncbi:MAG: FkbM family methyltransferase [Longimicrobiales bacterium]|nr:FkbM family methyltransferase [Longimicrobiales bacterium]